jgi:hypothetical protein
MSPFESKSSPLWVLALVVLLGFGLAVYASRNTHLGRTTNLALPGDFPEVYVQFKVDDENRCLVTDRGGSTADRAAPELQAARWNCRKTGPNGEGLLTLDGSRASYLFVPFEKVADPAFPFLYEAVKAAAGEPPLPRLRWVHFFVDRGYRGFFLQVTLPSRDFFEEKQLGELELMVAEGKNALACYDRKLRSLCPIYTLLVVDSIFPHPNYPPLAARLAALLPPEVPRAFLLSDKGAETLRPWPLPFAFQEMVKPEGKLYHDHRLDSWRPAAEAAAPAPWPGAENLSADAIAGRLRAAVEASCETRGCDPAPLFARIEASRSLEAIRGTQP